MTLQEENFHRNFHLLSRSQQILYIQILLIITIFLTFPELQLTQMGSKNPNSLVFQPVSLTYPSQIAKINSIYIFILQGTQSKLKRYSFATIVVDSTGKQNNPSLLKRTFTNLLYTIAMTWSARGMGESGSRLHSFVSIRYCHNSLVIEPSEKTPGERNRVNGNKGSCVNLDNARAHTPNQAC